MSWGPIAVRRVVPVGYFGKKCRARVTLSRANSLLFRIASWYFSSSMNQVGSPRDCGLPPWSLRLISTRSAPTADQIIHGYDGNPTVNRGRQRLRKVRGYLFQTRAENGYPWPRLPFQHSKNRNSP